MTLPQLLDATLLEVHLHTRTFISCYIMLRYLKPLALPQLHNATNKLASNFRKKNIPPGGKPRQRFEGFLKNMLFSP